MALPERRSRRFGIEITGLPLRYALFHLFFYCAFHVRMAQVGVGRRAVYAMLLAILLLAALLLPNEAARAVVGSMALTER